MSEPFREDFEPMRAGRMVLAVAIMVLAALAIGACGGDDDDDDAAPTQQAPRTVTSADLETFRRGSPERAILEWWRHVQFRDPEGAHALYSEDADVTLTDISRQVTFAASSFVGVPEVVDVDSGGDLATVYVVLQSPDSDVPPRPMSANLRKEEGSWVLRDNNLMDQQAARVARARAAAADG